MPADELLARRPAACQLSAVSFGLLDRRRTSWRTRSVSVNASGSKVEDALYNGLQCYWTGCLSFWNGALAASLIFLPALLEKHLCPTIRTVQPHCKAL